MNLFCSSCLKPATMQTDLTFKMEIIACAPGADGLGKLTLNNPYPNVDKDVSVPVISCTNCKKRLSTDEVLAQCSVCGRRFPVKDMIFTTYTGIVCGECDTAIAYSTEHGHLPNDVRPDIAAFLQFTEVPENARRTKLISILLKPVIV